MLKTKSTKEILSKFEIKRERSPSANIWEQFDKKDFKAIQERNVNEVSDLPVIYKKIINLIHFSEIAPKYKNDTFEKKLNLFTNIDDYNFFKQCYIREINDWHYLNAELSDDQKNHLYRLQLKINKT